MDQRLLNRLRRRRIAVLYGGWSAERPISIKSGEAVCRALKRLGMPHAVIDVSPDVARDLRRHKTDLAFLALHGPFGEDGTIQGLLEMLRIPYTGSGVLASAISMHKPTAKKIFQGADIPTPKGFVVTDLKAPFPSDKGPWFVKPASQGSAVGVTFVSSPNQWRKALRAALAEDREALVEKAVTGTEITVGILDGRALPVVEIVPKHAFYDFFSKYSKGGSRHLIPARLPVKSLKLASDLALEAFRAAGCRHFARVDFIVDKSGRPWILEINTLPGLTEVSILPDAAKAAGLSFDELVVEMLRLAADG